MDNKTSLFYSPEIGSVFKSDTLDPFCTIYRAIPSEITYLTNLKTLLLQNNNLAVKLPLAWPTVTITRFNVHK